MGWVSEGVEDWAHGGLQKCVACSTMADSADMGTVREDCHHYHRDCITHTYVLQSGSCPTMPMQQELSRLSCHTRNKPVEMKTYGFPGILASSTSQRRPARYQGKPKSSLCHHITRIRAHNDQVVLSDDVPACMSQSLSIRAFMHVSETHLIICTAVHEEHRVNHQSTASRARNHCQMAPERPGPCTYPSDIAACTRRRRGPRCPREPLLRASTRPRARC